LKDSSLVSVVAVADITRRGREFMAANFIPIETGHDRFDLPDNDSVFSTDRYIH
jgi:hypothetical protein